MAKFELASVQVYQENENNAFGIGNDNSKVISSNEMVEKFIFGPLDRGFGTTIGNAIRRVALSSLPGVAVCAIKFNSHPIYHEFSSIEKVIEDVTEIILNLKSLILSVDDVETFNDEVFRLNITKSEEGAIFAKDIDLDPRVKILNPDLYICSLAKGGYVDIDLFAKVGKGYDSSEVNKKTYHGTNEYFNDEKIIYIDSIYTPVTNAAFTVETTRVGQSSKFENVIIEVTTNKSIEPAKAIALSSMYLIEHFKLLNSIAELKIEAVDLFRDIEEVVEEEKPVSKNIEDLYLSVRSYNCLKRAGISTIDDLISKTEKEVKEIRNLGDKSYEEIIQKIHSLGYKFREK